MMNGKGLGWSTTYCRKCSNVAASGGMGYVGMLCGECEEHQERHDEVVKRSVTMDRQVGGTHYKDKAIQPIEYIMANNLDFNEGSVVKYITRHKEKGGAQDIEKIKQYCDFILKYQYGK